MRTCQIRPRTSPGARPWT